jgi:hypothetical protein
MEGRSHHHEYLSNRNGFQAGIRSSQYFRRFRSFTSEIGQFTGLATAFKNRISGSPPNRERTMVCTQIEPLVAVLQTADFQSIIDMPWNMRLIIERIRKEAQKYLQDVSHFVRTHKIKKGKILSFHIKDVACIKKGKQGKAFEFGRVFQLGRIGGNFMIAMACNSVRMDDKKVLAVMLKEHSRLFGQDVLLSLSTDKAYYSRANIKAAVKARVTQIGIQCPGSVKPKGIKDEKLAEILRDRRAGIEPLIGHVKKMGMAKSRAMSDRTTLASGYRSVLSFNLRQLQRHLNGEMKRAAFFSRRRQVISIEQS